MAVENLITEHLDIWTSAIKTKSAAGRGSSKKLELVGIKKLRELILELAVRGKLVQQDPNDEPASELLKKIEAEKSRLLSEGKIKKQKPFSQISDDEKPFALQNGWEWTCLGQITEIAPRNDLNNDLEVGFVPMPKVTNSYKGDHEQDIRVWSEIKKGYTHFADGDIGLAKITPCFENSKAAVFKDLKNGFGAGTTELHIARPIPSTINPLFVLLYLKAPMFLEKGKGKMTGSAGQKRIPNSFFSGNPLPFAPLKEQHRIVAKVDELMVLCDQLEAQTESSIDAHKTLVEVILATLTDAKDADELNENWQRLSQHFDVLFTTQASIDQLKQTILQLAVMGKLVKQNPNDEPASSLLKNIIAEKEQQVADKVVKKQKALSEIVAEDKYFTAPESWEWSRIGDASLFTEYGISAKTYDDIDGIPVLKMGDIQQGKVILGNHKEASADYPDIAKLMLKTGDVLYNRTNSAELVGKTGLFTGVSDMYSFASYLIRIRCGNDGLLPEYLNLVMNTLLFRITQIEPYLKQQCGQANVNGTIMKNMIIPVAPVLEQRRIVDKVNQLLDICEQLTIKISINQTVKVNLAKALVKQGLSH
jgi:type I restriction enzyme S subunit